MSDSSLTAKLVEESESLERSGDYAAALQHAQTALHQARADNDFPVIAAMLVRVSVIQYRLGHYDRAQAAANEALQFAAPDARARADALNTLGLVASEIVSFSDAESFFRLEDDLGREIGYPHARTRALHDLATDVYIPRGQFDLALTADREAIRIAREEKHVEWAVPALLTTAWNYQITGQVLEAHATLDELVQVGSNWPLAIGNSYWIKANLALDQDNPNAAIPLLEKTIAIAQDLGDTSLNCYTRLSMSRCHRLLGKFPSAHSWSNDAIVYAEHLGYRPLHGMALMERGRASWGIGEIAVAEADLKTSIEILTPLQATYDFTYSWLILAALYREQAQTQKKQLCDQAIDAWKKAARGIIAGGYAFLLQRERALAFPLVAGYLNHSDTEAATLAATLVEHLERVPAMTLQITTLGRFEVRQGCRTISERDWRKRSAGELFRLLLVSPGQSLTSKEIIEALWADKAPRSANEFLHQATSTLRRILEPELPAKFPSRYLDCEGEQICLRLPSDSWVDYQEFERHIESREWRAALALYHGDLFPGDRYADWATGLRERLRQRYIQALLALAEEHLAVGRAQDALDGCRRILEQERWHETAVLLGMHAALALNQHAEAVRLYQDLERALKEELDISPQLPLREFYESLLR